MVVGVTRMYEKRSKGYTIPFLEKETVRGSVRVL
jgi:hypothetical protein